MIKYIKGNDPTRPFPEAVLIPHYSFPRPENKKNTWTVTLRRTSARQYIFGFDTIKHWRDKSRTETIRKMLRDTVTLMRQNNIKTLAWPPIACISGNVKWASINGLFQELNEANPDLTFEICKPGEDVIAPFKAEDSTATYSSNCIEADQKW
jgi:hypothetical protein